MAGLGLMGLTLAVSCTQYSGMLPRTYSTHACSITQTLLINVMEPVYEPSMCITPLQTSS